ncbi:STAS/SEC14 domain-containing protein [Rhodobacteraceae bacterium F11138]|nr:STAS/SEC14 domain-containing protein [Rhodobacteraceae bacterium F11138]
MITATPVTPQGVMEIQLTGKLEARDYHDVLTPALEQAMADHDRLRMLVRIGPGFEGFSAGAAWADIRLGLRHWSGFDRIAVVTDADWIENGIKVMGFAFPGPVETFEPDELDAARRWLTESLGSIHMTPMGEDVLHVQLIGKLDSEAYEHAEDNLDAYVRDHGAFKLLLDLRDFDGWQGLAALGDHFKLVRDHRHIPSRVAIVGDEAWQKLAQKILRRFISAESRYFDEDQFDAARAFLG